MLDNAFRTFFLAPGRSSWLPIIWSDWFSLPVRPVQIDLIWFKLPKIDLKRPTWTRPPYPINTGCHDQLMATNLIENNPNSHTFVLSPFTLVLSLSTQNSVLTLICYSSFISVAIEGVLASLSMLEQMKVLLPRWGPSEVGVRWILHGDRLLWLMAKVICPKLIPGTPLQQN
jgi:hypothetical protein